MDTVKSPGRKQSIIGSLLAVALFVHDCHVIYKAQDVRMRYMQQSQHAPVAGQLVRARKGRGCRE